MFYMKVFALLQKGEIKWIIQTKHGTSFVSTFWQLRIKTSSRFWFLSHNINVDIQNIKIFKQIYKSITPLTASLLPKSALLSYRWLSQSANAAAESARTGDGCLVVRCGVIDHRAPGATALFISRCRWGSGVRQEGSTSRKCRSGRGWTSPTPWPTAPLSSPPSWYVYGAAQPSGRKKCSALHVSLSQVLQKWPLYNLCTD